MPITFKTFDFSYNQSFDDPSLRGIDKSRPWNLIHEILKHGSDKKSLLDIGCGSGLKLIEIAHAFSHITGLDHSSEMLKLAKERLQQQHITNFTLIEGKVDSLPFPNSHFDIVTVMMAPHHIDEIYRVLKPEGELIIETIGEMDKRELKDFFENGPILRGQLSERTEGSSVELYQRDLSRLFSEISIQEGFWETHYTEQGLWALLMGTPTVSHFDPITDHNAFKRALATLPRTGDKYIVRQHRLLVRARKPSQ